MSNAMDRMAYRAERLSDARAEMGRATKCGDPEAIIRAGLRLAHAVRNYDAAFRQYTNPFGVTKVVYA